MTAAPTIALDATMRDAALEYARVGLCVLPVWWIANGACACRKGSSCDQRPGKHPITEHGLNDATTDERTIREWWRRWPLANIGLALAPSGLMAFDVDTPEAHAAYAVIEAEHGRIVWRQRSGSGNLHTIAKAPAHAVRGQLDGITIRGRNYIVVSPSLHASGERYRWEEGCSPWDGEASELAPALAARLKRREGNAAIAPARPADNASALKRARRYIARMDPAIEGQHGHDKLFAACCRAVLSFGLSDADALQVILEEFNPRCVPPWSDAEIGEVERKIREARTNGDRSRWAVEDREIPDELRARRERKQPTASDHGSAGYGDRGGYRLTELGNARRLVDMHGSNLRYVSSWHTWLVWDGTRWRRDEDGATERAAKSVVAKIYADISSLAAKVAVAINGGQDASAPIDEMQKWARSSSKSSSINAMLKLAESELEIAATPDMFDRDPWLLNVANGTIDLRTGDLRPHSQADMITRITPIEYDADAECPQFLKFLRHVQPDDAVRDWLWRYLGYAATADVREQILAFFVGGGSNGKSVLLDVLLYVLGEYGLRAAPDLLLASANERHPTELNELDGRRLTVCSEIEQGKQWAESTIKRLTGDDTLKARGMRENFRTFDATNKIIVAANTRPNVRGTDDGIWRRMRVVPWPVRIPDGSRPDEKDERDVTLTARLKSNEATGILTWIVRGCIEWQKRGLTPMPRAIERATAQYRKEQDTLGRWIEDCCELGPENWEADAALYESYCKWCEQEENIHPWARRTWRERLTERPGIRSVKRGPRSEIRALLGIAIRRMP